MNTFLTKSRFTAGVQCEKRLWMSVNQQGAAASPSLSLQHLFWQGAQIGNQARSLFPGGVLINAVSLSSAETQTRRAIAQGAGVLFEATFIADDMAAKLDILRRLPNGTWEIIEVKSSTKVKPEHIPDIAAQWMVLEQAGLPVTSAQLLFINRDCVYLYLDDLFMLEDVTDHIVSALPAMFELKARFHDVLASSTAPDLQPGHHCDNPYKCPFKQHCWAGMPEYSIFTIPRLSADRLNMLASAGYLDVMDVPDGFPLTPTQQSYVDIVKDGQPKIDHGGVRHQLSSLSFPIYFLDFETDNPAIPRFDGMHPYDQVPFQYSCHRLDESGRIDHTGYLHYDDSDPRAPLAHQLVDDIGEEGSIVVYYAGFERRVLQQLAQDVPALSVQLWGMVDRLWDLYEVIKQHLDYPGFKGSKSIKAVLPVLVPGFSYEHLPVANGGDAQATWNKCIRLSDNDEKSRLLCQLRDYCALDTEAMLMIYRALLYMTQPQTAIQQRQFKPNLLKVSLPS